MRYFLRPLFFKRLLAGAVALSVLGNNGSAEAATGPSLNRPDSFSTASFAPLFTQDALMLSVVRSQKFILFDHGAVSKVGLLRNLVFKNAYHGASEFRQSIFYTVFLAAPVGSLLLPELFLQIHYLTQTPVLLAFSLVTALALQHIPQLYLGKEGQENRGKSFWQRLKTLNTRDLRLIAGFTFLISFFLPELKAGHHDDDFFALYALTIAHYYINIHGVLARWRAPIQPQKPAPANKTSGINLPTKVTVGIRQDIGTRHTDAPLERALWAKNKLGSVQVYGVAGGLVAHGHGDVASHLVREIIEEAIRNDRIRPDMNEVMLQQEIQQIICEARDVLLEKAAMDKRLHGMATTLAMVVLVGDNVALVHLGNPRIYGQRRDNGALELLTKDHTFGQVLLTYKTLPEIIRKHPHRGDLTKGIKADPKFDDYSIDISDSFKMFPSNQYAQFIIVTKGVYRELAQDEPSAIKGMSKVLKPRGAVSADQLARAYIHEALKLGMAREIGDLDYLTTVVVRLDVVPPATNIFSSTPSILWIWLTLVTAAATFLVAAPHFWGLTSPRLQRDAKVAA